MRGRKATRSVVSRRRGLVAQRGRERERQFKGETALPLTQPFSHPAAKKRVTTHLYL